MSSSMSILKKMAGSLFKSSALTSKDSKNSYTLSIKKWQVLPFSIKEATTRCLRLTLDQVHSITMKTITVQTIQVFSNLSTCFATMMRWWKDSIICSTSQSPRWLRFHLPTKSQLHSTGSRFSKTLSSTNSATSQMSTNSFQPNSTEISIRSAMLLTK